MEEIKLTRNQLFDLVWTEPLLRLSKRYCISDNGLRKMCKSMSIPLPPNGYWQKIKYGKHVMKPNLFKQYSGKKEVVLKPRTENCNKLSTAISAEGLQVKGIIADENPLLEVPDRLSSRPDPLITSTKAYFEAKKRYDWRKNESYPDRINVLNINVAEGSLSRAYRILDTLIKLLQSRNHEVKVSNYKSIAVIEGEEISFRLREKNKETLENTSYGSRIMKPTGDFVFAFGEYSWREKYVNDGKQRLETKLAIILAKMELESKREQEERIRLENRQKEHEEQERIIKEIRERKEAELKKFTDLFKDALQLHHATILRHYIEHLHANSDVGEDWIIWARKKIDWYDPLICLEDKLLDESHKESAFRLFLSLR